ncbi:hypothetical protein C8Q80DRAFT_1141337 [Daedaleopsis nitida]|nr:hypothetical protein C8Q80DRAFT_1141337 [Daedaleopsis nitida]
MTTAACSYGLLLSSLHISLRTARVVRAQLRPIAAKSDRAKESLLTNPSLAFGKQPRPPAPGTPALSDVDARTWVLTVPRPSNVLQPYACSEQRDFGTTGLCIFVLCLPAHCQHFQLVLSMRYPDPRIPNPEGGHGYLLFPSRPSCTLLVSIPSCRRASTGAEWRDV